MFSLSQAGAWESDDIQRRHPETTVFRALMQRQQSNLYAVRGSYPLGMLC